MRIMGSELVEGSSLDLNNWIKRLAVAFLKVELEFGFVFFHLWRLKEALPRGSVCFERRKDLFCTHFLVCQKKNKQETEGK